MTPILILLQILPKIPSQIEKIPPILGRIQRGRIGERIAPPHAAFALIHPRPVPSASALVALPPPLSFQCGCICYSIGALFISVTSCCAASYHAVASFPLNTQPPALDTITAWRCTLPLIRQRRCPRTLITHHAATSHPPAHQPLIAVPFLVHLRLLALLVCCAIVVHPLPLIS